MLSQARKSSFFRRVGGFVLDTDIGLRKNVLVKGCFEAIVSYEKQTLLVVDKYNFTFLQDVVRQRRPTNSV